MLTLNKEISSGKRLTWGMKAWTTRSAALGSTSRTALFVNVDSEENAKEESKQKQIRSNFRFSLLSFHPLVERK